MWLRPACPWPIGHRWPLGAAGCHQGRRSGHMHVGRGPRPRALNVRDSMPGPAELPASSDGGSSLWSVMADRRGRKMVRKIVRRAPWQATIHIVERVGWHTCFRAGAWQKARAWHGPAWAAAPPEGVACPTGGGAGCQAAAAGHARRHPPAAWLWQAAAGGPEDRRSRGHAGPWAHHGHNASGRGSGQGARDCSHHAPAGCEQPGWSQCTRLSARGFAMPLLAATWPLQGASCAKGIGLGREVRGRRHLLRGRQPLALAGGVRLAK